MVKCKLPIIRVVWAMAVEGFMYIIFSSKSPGLKFFVIFIEAIQEACSVIYLT